VSSRIPYLQLLGCLLLAACASSPSSDDFMLRCFSSGHGLYQFGSPEALNGSEDAWLVLGEAAGPAAGLLISRESDDLFGFALRVADSPGDSLHLSWHDPFTSSEYVVVLDRGQLQGRAFGTSDHLVQRPDGSLSVSEWERGFVARHGECPTWVENAWRRRDFR
jgi:hypothetical protein